MWTSVLAGYALVTLGALAPGGTHVKCNQQCDAGYSADVDECRFQFNTPADADALTDCIQRARDDYRSCLDDCASAAISLPGWRILVALRPAWRPDHSCPGQRTTEHAGRTLGPASATENLQGNACGSSDGQIAPGRCSGLMPLGGTLAFDLNDRWLGSTHDGSQPADKHGLGFRSTEGPVAKGFLKLNRPASQLSLRSVPVSSDARRFALAESGSRP